MKSTTLSLMAGISLLSLGRAEAAQVRPPNVIVIVADDLGYGDTGVYGSKIVKTPNIDALAADGVRFTQGYVAHPVCAPSRAAILTGRYQTRFGYEFNPVGRDRFQGVSRNETFIGEVMHRAGYHTGMVGKWHLGEAPGFQPMDRGFDEFFGILGGFTAFQTHTNDGDDTYNPPGSAASYRTTALSPLPASATPDEEMTYLRQQVPVRRGREVVEVSDYLTDAFSADAVRFIDQNKAKPFFLYLAYNAPHTPLQASKKYLDRYRDVPDRGQRVYAAMVSGVDDGVGALRAKLKAEGLEKSTLIVFLSDNGCASYVLGACTNAPFSGFKGTHLEGGVRIPYIVTWPGKIRAGQTDGRMVSSLDIAPTAAALAGASLPHGTDGVNLIPYLTGANPGTPNPTLFWRAGVNFAIRQDKWKMWMVNKADPSKGASHEAGITPDGKAAKISPQGQHVMLYDLVKDPKETRNLAKAQAPMIARLKARISAWDKANIAPQWTSMRQSIISYDEQLLELFD